MDFTVKEETFCVLQENICKFKYCDLGDFRNLNGCVNMDQASWWFWSGFFESKKLVTKPHLYLLFMSEPEPDGSY